MAALTSEPTTVSQHAVRLVLAIVGLSIAAIVLAIWAGLIGGLCWLIFQTVWGLFG